VTGPVFLTGGSGFVGGALVRALLAEGREVRALARSDESADALATLGASVVRGDIDDHGALLGGMRGCSTVFHVAGLNAMCARDPAPMLHVNVDGAATVVRAAAAARVARVVHTSSATTIGERAGEVGREDTHHRGSFMSNY
jgi:dihydroflavonol-4-reductase